MKTNFVALVMVISMTSMVYGGYLYSDYDWTTYNGHQYAITLDWSTWNQAEQWAVEVGGYLASINNDQENVWLTNEFGGYYAKGYEGNTTASYVWIGLHYIGGDINLSTSWEWASGEPLAFDPPWYRWVGLPVPLDVGGTPYVYLHTCTHFDPGSWWNGPGEGGGPGARGIIEVVPEPGTVLLVGLGALLLRRRRR
jgi:hypothetical protein